MIRILFQFEDIGCSVFVDNIEDMLDEIRSYIMSNRYDGGDLNIHIEVCNDDQDEIDS